MSRNCIALAAFQAEADQRFAPPMRRRIDLDSLYAAALKQIKVADHGSPPPLWPGTCPLTLDALLNDSAAELEPPMAVAISSP
jgi:hypothetical protein